MTARVTITDDDGVDSDYLVPDNVAQIFLSVSIERDKLRQALTALLDRYTELVNSGDCGFWCPENEAEVVEARRALSD
jgi:hypothetical protein